MATNEETNFVTGNEQTKEEKKVADQNLNGWQSVTIGGVTGILMGAGTMYAAESFATQPNTEETEHAANATTTSGPQKPNEEDITNHHAEPDGLKVAEVDQNLSFGEAFEAARNSVGPGGVFHWHGGIYNTYRLEEWNAMSANEKAQFAQQVKPEIQPGEENTGHKNNNAHNHIKHDEPKPEPKPEPEPHEDDDIHFLGFTNVKLEGHEYEAGKMSIRVGGEDRHVYLVDLDHDPKNEFDIGLYDRNGDGEFTMREAFDARDMHLNVDEFSLVSSMNDEDQSSTLQTNQTALNTQDEIANNMPDYANDADPII